MIGDRHSAYWPAYGGGLGRPAFFARLGRIIDDMHHWHDQPDRISAPSHAERGDGEDALVTVENISLPRQKGA